MWTPYSEVRLTREEWIMIATAHTLTLGALVPVSLTAFGKEVKGDILLVLRSRDISYNCVI